MKNGLNAIVRTPLFDGVAYEDAEKLIGCLEVICKRYPKGDFVIMQGEKNKGLGIVVSGRLHIIKEDFLGNRDIIAQIEAGDIFAEAYAVLSDEKQSVSVVAEDDSEVAFLSMDKLMRTCQQTCGFHNRVIENLVRVMAKKNLLLTRKMVHMSKRNMREKLISYLSEQATRTGDMKFTIPFDRQQLADFLAVDRSAMSRELSKMRDEGLIEFYKNQFILYNKNGLD